MIQRLRVPLGFVIAAAVLYLARPTGMLILTGLPIAMLGVVFRGLAAGVIRKDSVLTTCGPYAWTRNPLYLGSFLLGLGFAVMSGSWVAAALILIPFSIIYPNVIRKEEAHLARLFPEQFRDYCARVPRFVPRFRPIEGVFSMEQYLRNREYRAAAGFAVLLAVFILKWRLI